jgi:foldase protein PrsA
VRVYHIEGVGKTSHLLFDCVNGPSALAESTLKPVKGRQTFLLPQVCYNHPLFVKNSERTKTLKHKLIALMLLLTLVLVACDEITTPTVPAATETEPAAKATEVEPAATATETEPAATATEGSEIAPAVTPESETAALPGGVDVALALAAFPDQDNVAVVNGEDISTSAYREELERALYSVTAQYALDWNSAENQSLLPSFQDQVLDQIIERTLLRQLAGEEGITAEPDDVEAEIASIKTQIENDPSYADWDSFLVVNNLTDEDIRGLIADQILTQVLIENHGGSALADHVNASHILVETEETGQEVLDKLADGEDFGELAAEYSTDPGSKDQGGDLGWFPPGMMVPEFEEAAFSLEPGEMSGLVESDFGYHIILVHDKEEREMDPNLFAQVQQREFTNWLDAQRADAAIERLFTFGDSE